MKAVAKENLNQRWMRRWFREQYGLSPKDERYLLMTHEEIEIDFYEHQGFQEHMRKAAEATSPVCTQCGHRGKPLPNTMNCPTCGASMEMEAGDGDPRRTVYVDDDFEEYARSLGIDESALED